ncbi:MAG TPA: sigma-70 family RNA polymerase sigma factor [Puia sp.]
MTDTGKNNGKEPGESDLLARVATGDQLAFAEMVRRYWNTIYSHGLVYLKSAPRAEEITQDVFMKIWTGREKLPEVRNLDNYLFIIARNHIFNEARKKINLIYGDVGERAETSFLPDLQTEYKESYQQLLKGIELLPEKRRQVFKLSRLEGLSNEQIATRLGIHKDTVYQYLVKALLFLRAYMQEHMGGTLLVLLLIREWRRIK